MGVGPGCGRVRRDQPDDGDDRALAGVSAAVVVWGWARGAEWVREGRKRLVGPS